MQRSGWLKRTPFKSKVGASAGARHTRIAPASGHVEYKDTRKALLKRRPGPARRSSRVEDKAYLAWLRLQPCGVARLLGRSDLCGGPTDPDHERQGVGMGQRASDRRAWPCCRIHHSQRHDLNGFFRGFDGDRLTDFIERRIEDANVAYERSGGVFVSAD
jgi:hypothetical protein